MTDHEAFFAPDPRLVGSKGLVFVGDKIIVYRRTEDAPIHPLELDLPGGGAEPDETPFRTFQREVHEEFGLHIREEDIVYVYRFPATAPPGGTGYFPVARLDAAAERDIVFGDEGIEYMIMAPEEFVAREDAWPAMRERTARYLATLAA